MRFHSLLAIGLVATLSLVVVGSASAVTPDQKLVVKVTPAKAGTPKKPRAVSLFVNPYLTALPTDPPFATSKAVLTFDKNLIFNSKKFPTCTAGQITVDQDKCPAKSRVGSGSAVGSALGLQQKDIVVTVFNAPGGNGVLLHVTGASPLTLNSVMTGVLKKTKSGSVLTVTIPQDLQTPTPGVVATLTDFRTTISAKNGKTPYVALAGCPKKKKLAFSGVFNYIDDQSNTSVGKAKTTAPCKR